MEFKIGSTVSREDSDFFEKYVSMADWCNSTEKGFILQESEDRKIYTIVKAPSFKESKEKDLKFELNELYKWFDKYHYVAEKIAYGRATREEYADIISQMDAKAERINQIRAELAELGVENANQF